MKVPAQDSLETGRLARVIAFYLPQFHPIPENDTWWGRGFTEWTNVAKAVPLFPGHLQPRLPADLGFYDLRVPEVREAQAALARHYGVEGFCYWHYWFGGGRRLLERPFNEVLSSGRPDLPFCLGWANQTWTGVWHGAPNRILVEQTYPGRDDCVAHFYEILPALADPRAIAVDGRKLFVIYCPQAIPDCAEYTGLWRNLAAKEGLPGIYFVGVIDRDGGEAGNLGLDGWVAGAPIRQINDCLRAKAGGKTSAARFFDIFSRIGGRDRRQRPVVCDYAAALDFFDYDHLDPCGYPVIVPGWDNTPRSGRNGYVLTDADPAVFEAMVAKALAAVASRSLDRRLIFLKSWNEWAEGNFVEPSVADGHRFLAAIRAVVGGSVPSAGRDLA